MPVRNLLRHALFGALLLISACGGRFESHDTGAAGSAGATGGHAGSGAGPGEDGGGHTDGGGNVGGSGGDPGTGGDIGVTGGAAGAPLHLPSGSYDVMLNHVTITPDSQGGPPPPSSSSPSEGMYLRIDYRQEGNATAVVTPRWGDPAAYTVSWEGDAIVLTGSALASGSTGSFERVRDRWTTLRLSPSATPGGIAFLQASGDETIDAGDLEWSAKITSKGDVNSDAMPPELRSQLISSVGPSDALLPWDALKLRAAEGVTIGAEGPTLVYGAVAGSVPVTWTIAQGDPSVAWAGSVELAGTPTTWEGLGGASMLLGVLTSTVQDLALHPMASAFSTKYQYLDVGKPVDDYTFDGDGSAQPGGWGTVTYYGQKTGSDPLCASGGCVELGPFENGHCNVPRMGIAGRLINGGSTLLVHYRVVSADGPGGGEPSASALPPFTVQIAAIGFPAAETEIPVPKFHDLGSAAGGLHWSSDDLTAKIPAAAELSKELGVAIYAGNQSRLGCLLFGLPWPPGTKTAVVIDSIGF